MTTISRREFLHRSQKTGWGLAAGLTILDNAASVWGTPANEKIVMAVVGVRGRGGSLAPGFASRGDCEIAYVCDVDSNLFASRGKSIAEAQGGKTPKFAQDFRKALDDKSVDAMIIATPDHWHVPGGRLELPGGQGRLRGETAQPQLLGRAQAGRGREEVRADRAGGHAEPQRRLQSWTPSGTSRRASWGGSISAASRT